MREIHDKGSRGTNKKDHLTDIIIKLYIPTVPCIRKHMPPMKKNEKNALTSDDMIYNSLLDWQRIKNDF